jgi:phosphoglycolate phosphatase
MNYRAVFFDLDGTLVDSLEDLTAAVNYMLSVFNTPALTAEDVRKLVGKGARNLVQRALGARSAEEIEHGLQLFSGYNAAHIADASRLYPGISEILELLASDKVKMVVISNKNEKLCRSMLEALNVDGFFDIIAGGDTFAEMKPSPLPLMNVMQRLGVSTAETVMVGDSINDILAGNRAGVRTIGCSWGFGDSCELDDATLRVPSSNELLFALSRSGGA